MNMQGTVEVPGGVSVAIEVDMETGDVLDTTSMSNQLQYNLSVVGTDVDGFDFVVPEGACFTPTVPANAPVYIGRGNMELISEDLSLDTMSPCDFDFD